MHSRRDLLRHAVVIAALAMASMPMTAAHIQNPAGQGRTAGPAPAEISHALEAVKADPNLAPETTVRTLRWKDSGQVKSSAAPSWLAWIAGLFGWLEQSARVLVWCGAALLAGLAAVFVVRLTRARAAPSAAESFVAPTHVRDLDIRPETLPDNIGEAARGLWDRGEHRAALALLYRGLLSRLVHVHRIAIRDSTTEGDSLALAATHLTQSRHEYASSLVAVWQRAVYGRQDVHAAAVYALCDGFGPALDATPERTTAVVGPR